METWVHSHFKEPNRTLKWLSSHPIPFIQQLLLQTWIHTGPNTSITPGFSLIESSVSAAKHCRFRTPPRNPGSNHYKDHIRASLVAQGLRIHLPMQGTQVWALGREGPTCRGATKPVRHNYWACARAREPQLLSPYATTTEACVPRARALQQEKPPQWETRVPQRRVAPAHRN